MTIPDPQKPFKFLVIRRDNIGDLVCTTPVFEALRKRFPNAHIYALTSTYNLPVLFNNPYVDEAFAYTKGKHRSEGVSIARVYWDRVRLILRLRRMQIDYAILAGTGHVERSVSFARALAPRHIVSHVEVGRSTSGIDMPVSYRRSDAVHEVEDVFSVLAPLGIVGPPPPLCVVPAPPEHAHAEAVLQQSGLKGAPIAVHISARKLSNRWPVERFAELMRTIHAAHGVGFLLFWSPGSESNRMHPGDDEKAQDLMARLRGVPVVPYPTTRLQQLIAGLSVCERVICSDGGAMHVAAALGKPIVCFFGNSGATRWRPWGVPHILLQPPSLNAADVSVAEALSAFERLCEMSAVNVDRRA